jgi:hypothetical protein
MARKTRDEVSIREVIALLDGRLARVRSFRRHVYANKVELKSRGVHIRKLNELRLERLVLSKSGTRSEACAISRGRISR